MRLYFAGSFSGVPVETLRSWGMQYKLYSYTNEPKPARIWGSDGLLLDSGAYSAMTKGIKISIPSLCRFIDEVKPEHAIQLDVIGDPEATWKNFMEMDKRVDVIPVIHSGTTDFQIRRILQSKDHICLGALTMLAAQKSQMFAWLDHIFSFPEMRGKRVHILGVMAPDILLRYPFYSADSSSALSAVRYPMGLDDEYLFWKQKTQHYTRLYEDSIKKQLDQEYLITEIWKKRGIVWE